MINELGQRVPGMLRDKPLRTDDIVIVVCDRKMDKIPNNCSFCSMSTFCTKAFKFKQEDEEIAINFERKYTSRGNDVVRVICKCEEKIFEARISSQIYINCKHIITGGYEHEKESTSLRHRRQDLVFS